MLGRRRIALAALAGVAFAAGCGGDPPIDRCAVTQRTQALAAPERKLVGEASPYPADPLLRARTDELDSSQRARREAAWQAVARVLEPVALAADLPAHAGPDVLPRWHTWYGRDDLRRLFQKVWRALPLAMREAREPLPDAALDDAFAWNPTAVDEDANWTAERWTAYLDSLDDAADLEGIGGIGRVGYAPAAARHLLASYAEEVGCFEDGPPAPFVDGPATPPTVTREAVALAACEQGRFGPYFVAGGERLSARADGEVALHRDAADADPVCIAAAGDTCEVEGPGAIWVSVSSLGDPVDGELVIEHAAPDAPWAGCLDGRFPLDAAVVKADWRRAELGITVPIHDTSAAGLAATRAAGSDWGDGEGEADPGADAIYTARTSQGNLYRLVALHIMTRELDHWLWVTLWWSPDPDDDFGADRPAALTDLGGPWGSYKMCAVTAFDEGDPVPSGGFDGTLGASLAAVHAGAGGPSWCSNPYLELGHGNADTNCVGCHQHGGTTLRAEDLLGDEDAFPDRTRAQIRNNFPSDYAWSTVDGDRLAQMLRDEILYWDGVE